jgi:hypothetical protein
MSWPYRVANTQNRPRPLKSQSGDEKAKSIVLYSSVVELNTNSQRIVNGGTLLCKITSGLGVDKYGPYLKTASDGRQTVAELSAFFNELGHDVTLGDKGVEGLFADCVFDKSELAMGGLSLHGASLTTLKAAFPQCTFDD